MKQPVRSADWIVGLHGHYWMSCAAAAVDCAQFCTQSTRKENPWVMPITAASTSKHNISFSTMRSDSGESHGLLAALAELQAARLPAGESRGGGTGSHEAIEPIARGCGRQSCLRDGGSGSHEAIEPRTGLRCSPTTIVAASTNP